MADYKEIRSIQRGFDVLMALNRHNGSTPSEVAAMIGVHRTTVRRILETMVQAGFVARSDEQDRFFLRQKVRALSEGYDDDAWITETAGPLLRNLVEKIRWPAELATLEGDVMVVRESTQSLSPLSVFRKMIATRWPVMTTALGRAYLSFCDDEERERLLAVLRRSTLPGNRSAGDPRYVAGLIERTRQRGYGESVLEAAERIAAIALPVRQGPRVLGCVNVIFFASAMSPTEAAARYLPSLTSLVAEVERSVGAGRTRTAAVASGNLDEGQERVFLH